MFCQIKSHLITLSIIELVEKRMVIGAVCLHISLARSVKSTREYSKYTSIQGKIKSVKVQFGRGERGCYIMSLNSMTIQHR